MSALRVALILNEPPLPHLSAATRSYHAMIKEFERRGVDLHVFATGVETAEIRESLQAAYPTFHQRIRLFAPGHPNRFVDKVRNALLPMAFMTGAALERALRRIPGDEPFDIVHVEHPWTARALPRGFHGVPALLSLHYFLDTDFAVSPPPRSISERVGRWRLLRAEGALIRMFSDVRVLSREMEGTLTAIHPRATAHVIPLAIDPSDYEYVDPPEEESAEPVVTMIGSMFWPPSLAAADRLIKRLWPSIREHVPQARLRIVGRDARRAFGEFDGKQGIAIEENVPEVLPYFRSATVLVYAPRVGSGMKVKVQESMLLGLPVVTDRCGAEGLDPVDGQEAMLAETDDELVAATVKVLTDRALRQSLARGARQLVERLCGPSMVVDRFLESYARVIARHERPISR